MTRAAGLPVSPREGEATDAGTLDVHIRRHIVDARFTIPLEPAGITVLFGPSGSGKTTILRCLAGLDRIDSGLIEMAGRTWDDGARGQVPARDRRVGYLFQEFALFPHLSVGENVAYGVTGLSRAGRAARVREALASANVTGYEDRKIGDLSGGEAQRVALARALAPEPRLLLLDEPLSALDAPTRLALRAELRRLILHADIPAIVVTHDRDEALALADRLIVVIGGTVRQSAAPSFVFDHPADADTARAVGMETTAPGTIAGVAGDSVQVTVGRVTMTAARDTSAAAPPQIGSRIMVCVRAGDVGIERSQPGLLRPGGSPVATANRLPATITSITDEASLVRVELDAGFPLSCYVTRRERAERGLLAGASVVVVVEPSALHLVSH